MIDLEPLEVDGSYARRIDLIYAEALRAHEAIRQRKLWEERQRVAEERQRPFDEARKKGMIP